MNEKTASGNDPPRRRHIEREFGVPIAGEILEPERWSNTALKRLPDAGPLDVDGIFRRQAPLVADLGCGNGRFLIQSAVWRPDCDHLGIDLLPVVIRYATRRGNQRGLTNLRFAAGCARRLVAELLPTGRAAEIHCYHPQPYFDAARMDRRLITGPFLAHVHRALIRDGQFFIQTDNPGYWDYIRQIVGFFFDFEARSGPWPDAPKGRTRREIIALRRGLPVFRGRGIAKQDLSFPEAVKLAESLPAPRFDANPTSRELDDLEQFECYS